jgi:hypothetical protein
MSTVYLKDLFINLQLKEEAQNIDVDLLFISYDMINFYHNLFFNIIFNSIHSKSNIQTI